MRNMLLKYMVMIGLSCLAVNAADINKAFDYYDKGDFKSAFSIFKQLANDDNAQAQYMLFSMYAKGEYVARDLDKAVQWVKKSAALGFYDAHVSLGDMYLNGTGVEKDINAAIDWFTIAADEGSPIAMAYLAEIYNKTKNKELAAKWWEKAATAGHIGSMYNTALSYCVPSIGKKEQDLRKCAYWAKKAKENGYDVSRLWKDFKLSKYE